MSNLKTIISIVIMALLISASMSYPMTFKKAEPVKKRDAVSDIDEDSELGIPAFIRKKMM